MERIYKYLQVTALIVALLAPWIYFVGYAYDWGYLDSFSIEHLMFFKAPQEYFGLAYLVFLEFVLKIVGAIPDGLIKLVCVFVMLLVLVFFAVRYWGHRSRLWPRLYLWCSNWLLHKRGKITLRFVTSVAAPAYLVSSFPVLVIAGILYLLILVISPGLIGYSKGQEAAKKIKDEWQPAMCAPQSKMFGCAQILEAGNPIATGILVVASERYAAIFDGSSVQIYTLRNRDIRIVLAK